MNMYDVELEEYSMYSVRNNSPKSLKSITTIPATPLFKVPQCRTGRVFHVFCEK